MIWNIEEYQGIFSINRGLVDHLNNYLDEKEAQLSMEIIGSVHAETLTPLLEPPSKSAMRFQEAVEEFGKKILRIKNSNKEGIPNDEWKTSVAIVNRSLWEYVETLEGCVVELFQQLDQVSFDHWNADLSHSVSLIKDNLMHRLEDVLWGIKRLNYQIKDYRWLCEEKQKNWMFWLRPGLSWAHLIERSLSVNLLKSQKYLGYRYQQFMDKYNGYLQLYDRCEAYLDKFYDYKILVSQDLETQDKLKKFDLYLNLWDLNRSAKALPEYEPAWVLRSSISPYSAINLLHEYFDAIKREIFEKSRLIKKKFQIFFQDQEGRDLLAVTLTNYRVELEKLRSMAVKYRDFLQKSEHGYHEKSRENKKLTALIDDVLRLDDITEKFRYSLENEGSPSFSVNVDQAIQKHLHEMGQPLATKEAMQSGAESVLKLLNGLDELGTYNPYIVDYVGNSLLKAMKADWKYHVLQGIPLFHQVYEIHKNVADRIDERQHLNRLNMFKRIIGELEDWINSGDMLKHTQEIEADLSDLKGYLQDFFARIQRMGRENVQEKEEMLANVSKANQKILEYRYLFGKFFYKFSQKSPEERLLRKQLLFVDQYFESIETKLQEIKKAQE